MLFIFFFFFSSRRRHTIYWRDWSSDVCSSDLVRHARDPAGHGRRRHLTPAVAGQGPGACSDSRPTNAGIPLRSFGVLTNRAGSVRIAPVSQTRVGSLESLRRLNRLRVIDALRAEGLISRADIARRTGLSRSTVSSLVSDLQADGLVVEREETAAAFGDQGGRPPILLSFDASAGAAVGIDFGHRHLRVAVSDLASNILAERRLQLDTDHSAQDGLEAATELVAEALADAGVDRSRVV